MPKATKFREEDLPSPGSVFLATLADGRFGVLRVIQTKSASGYACALVVPSSWIGAAPVRPSDDEIRLPLILTHHWHRILAKRANQQEAAWVFAPPPASFIPVSGIEITGANPSITQDSYSTWEFLSGQILRQWRWDNDREALLVEDAAKESSEATERRLAEERRAEMLRTVTFDGLSTRIWFENWDEKLDDPHLSGAREIISHLIDSIRNSPKGTKAVVRRLLRATVKDFNRLDAKNSFIETTHREDIHETLEIVMAAARYPELADEIEQWREW